MNRLLAQWLEDGALEAQRRADRANDALNALRNQETEYARAIQGIASAHAEAANVYRRALMGLGKR